MTAVATKTKIVKDDNLTAMFNEMFDGRVDPEIVARKKTEFVKAAGDVRDTLLTFATGPVYKKYAEYRDWLAEIEKFAKDITPLTDEKAEYKVLKEHEQTRRVVTIAVELGKYKQYLGDELSGSWIMRQPGFSYVPFTFSKFDLKNLWSHAGTTDAVKGYCLAVLQKVWRGADKISEVITTADINPKDVSAILIKAIDKSQKIPELSRCREAFKTIRQSLSMLEENFNSYYAEMVASGDKNTIFTSFISDVSRAKANTPTLIREFRQIAIYHKKMSTMAGQKNTDPRYAKVLDGLIASDSAAETKGAEVVPELPAALASDISKSTELKKS